MKYTVHVGDKPIVFEHGDFDSTINVDDLTKIDTSNLFGEAVTISAAVNRVGLLKAETEGRVAEARLAYKIFEADYKSKLRKQAANNGGFYTLRVGNEDVKIKLTESSLSTSFENDPEWIKIKEAHIKAEKNFGFMEALYWACQDKSRKLNGLVNGTTPQEFVAGIIEGKINGILIKK